MEVLRKEHGSWEGNTGAWGDKCSKQIIAVVLSFMGLLIC